MNLFLVENSNYLRDRLAKLVEHRAHAHVIGHAATANQAIDGISRTQPDVVLLDIRLDEGNGMDVLRQVKHLKRPPVVFVLTNYAYPQYRAKFIESGADYFFDKSTELDAMVQTLEAQSKRLTKKRTEEPC
jgi:DNA-binding NarL/FixJ family response regulator